MIVVFIFSNIKTFFYCFVSCCSLCLGVFNISIPAGKAIFLFNIQLCHSAVKSFVRRVVKSQGNGDYMGPIMGPIGHLVSMQWNAVTLCN